MVASKTVLLLFSSNVKSSKFPKKWFWRRIRIFANYSKGLAVFLFIREHFPSFKKCDEKSNTVPEIHFCSLWSFVYTYKKQGASGKELRMYLPNSNDESVRSM